jgi:hypothetical protein
VRKNGSEYPTQVSLYTSDLPPVPVRQNDILNITFLLENNVGTATVRYKIASATFHGQQLEAQLQSAGGKYVTVLLISVGFGWWERC